MASSSHPGRGRGRRGQGRRRTREERMENESNLMVTFSKRRSGLFKKASELVTLCGTEIGVIFFSPSNKAFTFGHPDIDTIIDRFLQQADVGPQEGGTIVEEMMAQRRAIIDRMNNDLTQVIDRVQSLKVSGKHLDDRKRVGLEETWVPPNVNEMDANQHSFYMAKYLEFVKALAAYILHKSQLASFGGDGSGGSSFVAGLNAPQMPYDSSRASGSGARDEPAYDPNWASGSGGPWDI